MGLLANFKIRTKVLVALLPLVVMVIVATLYASIEMGKIASWYNGLISNDVRTLHRLTIARSLSNQFGLFLYKEIAEPNLDTMQVVDTDLDETAARLHRYVDEAKQASPTLAPAIDAATSEFDRAVSDSRPVRAATLGSQNESGEMSRALQALQSAARERETLGWVKAEVAATVEKLQSADNSSEFATILLSRISESFSLLYGAFYLADQNERFTRVGAFATDVSTNPRAVAFGETLVGQAAVERRALQISSTEDQPLQVSAGAAAVTPACVLFIPVVN